MTRKDKHCSTSSDSSSDCKRGPKGDRGKRGHRGHRGPTGATGAMGTVGDTGATGPTGPTGAPGRDAPLPDVVGLAEFSYFYTTSFQLLPRGSPVQFNTSPVLGIGNITLDPTGTIITIGTQGWYQISYMVTGIPDPAFPPALGQFALYVNGGISQLMNYTADSGTNGLCQVSGQATFVLNAGDKITLANNSQQNANFTIPSSGTSAITSSICIDLLSPIL